jgi:nucleotidyltransferase/DNA polymerase involved in DNA repair
VDPGSAIAIAEEIRARILAETGLTASARVSHNKFLAKLASDYRKLDGLFVITPRMASAFVERLPIGKFHGVGSVTAAKLNKLRIRTGLDLRQQTRAFLRRISARLSITSTTWQGPRTIGPRSPLSRASYSARRRPLRATFGIGKT